jgi:hypothetical protein
MKTKLAPKKQRQQFLAKVAALLLDLGATPGDYDFALQTKAGLLKLHPSENMAEGLGTVFTRFDDPQAARQLVNCNPFSGKWNHFYFSESLDAALEDIAFQLAKVLG